MSEEDRTFKELVEEAHLRILLAQLDGSDRFRTEVYHWMNQAVLFAQETKKQ